MGSGAKQDLAQTDPRILEQAVRKYNSAGLEEQGRILSQMYKGRAKLLPVDYNNRYEMLNEFLLGPGDYINAGVNFGDLQVRWTMYNQGGFTLTNTPEFVTADGQGRLQYSFLSENSTKIAIPPGHSLLVVEEGSDKYKMEELLESLDHFARKHPKVGIDDAKIGIIRNGLKYLDYYR